VVRLMGHSARHRLSAANLHSASCVRCVVLWADRLVLVRDTLTQRGLRLEYATLGWNVVGVPILLVAAIRSGSAAAAGFGFDSAIEIVASLVVVWELTGAPKQREAIGLRLIGLAFLAVAVYVTALAAVTLVGDHHPDVSRLGIVWTAATCVVMLVLARGKAVTGAALGNPVLVAEGRVTLVDACLAAAVLVGLSLNAVFGWWWADPLAGLVVVGYAVREARHALRSP
jgi:divalent metal cation (Fe/Co/Zn/Cd) transporter